MGTFAETSGTYVNLEGQWQSFSGAAQPVGQSRPGWKVLRVLGNLFGFEGFDQQTSEEVREELKVLVARGAGTRAGGVAVPGAVATGEIRVVDVPPYQVDGIVRRAPSLQRTREGRSPGVTFGAGSRA
jgi:NADH-quinone oxidoreductase subunit G